MLKTNQEQLVESLLEGCALPTSDADNAKNKPVGLGGVSLNLKLGDSVFGWAVDHATPCVSIYIPSDIACSFACLGNEARVLTGEAKGTRGTITGICREFGRVMIDFPDSIFEHLSLEDKIQIRATGQGLHFGDYEDILVGGISTQLVDKMKIEEDVQEQQLRVPVTAKVPSQYVVSGNETTFGVHLDLRLQSASLEGLSLEHLRLGDVIALVEHPTAYKGLLQQEMVSIGIVTYTASSVSGLGPGIQTILAGSSQSLIPFLQEDANIGRYLNLGRYRSLF